MTAWSRKRPALIYSLQVVAYKSIACTYSTELPAMCEWSKHNQYLPDAM